MNAWLIVIGKALGLYLIAFTLFSLIDLTIERWEELPKKHRFGLVSGGFVLAGLLSYLFVI